MAECRGCGKLIIWGIQENGVKVPLDPSAPVYVLLEKQGPGRAQKIMRVPDEYMVSHFKTCPNANEFSRSRKEKKS